MENENQKASDLDLSKIITAVKKKRFFIYKFAIVFFCIGLVVALLMIKEYSASCTITSQSSSGAKIGGNLGGLASLAGIELAGFSSSGDVIPITLYPRLLQNINFQRELLKTPLTLSKMPGNATFYDYGISPKYKRFLWWKKLKANTIGLPAKIQRQKAQEQLKSNLKRIEEPTFIPITEAEYSAIGTMLSSVDIIVNTKDNYVQIKTHMPEAVAAAQVAAATKDLLQKYVIEYKTQKTQNMLNFVQERFNEAELQYKERKDKLARFQDANRTLNTAISQTRGTQLEEESLLSFDVYASLAKQLEQTKIDVKENIPVFVVLEPVVVPIEAEGLGRVGILLIFMALGFVLPIGIIVLIPSMSEVLHNDKLLIWLDKEENVFFNLRKKQ